MPVSEVLDVAGQCPILSSSPTEECEAFVSSPEHHFKNIVDGSRDHSVIEAEVQEEIAERHLAKT